MPPALFYLVDSSSQVWELGVTNAGAYTTTAVSGPTGLSSYKLEDTVTHAAMALSVLTSGALEVSTASGSGAAEIALLAPNGSLWALEIAGGAIEIVPLFSSFPVSHMSSALVAYGCQLMFSLDNVHFTTVAQLRKFKGPESKQTIVDQTNILTAGNSDAPLAARYSSGEAEMDGVFKPQSSSQLTLGQMHANLTNAFWKLLLSDEVTVYTWQGLVSEYQPFDIEISKAIAFSAKIRVWGSMAGPLGAF